jgi:uncharacterized protein YhhL (DUF1145 family)
MLIQTLIVLVVVGVVLYLINQYIPMAPPIKTVINVLIVLVLVVWLLRMAGLLGGPAPPLLR